MFNGYREQGSTARSLGRSVRGMTIDGGRGDICQFKTILVIDLPRIACSERGVVTVVVSWAESGSGFTALYEALVIDWLKEASVQAVSRRMGLSWNAVDGIM